MNVNNYIRRALNSGAVRGAKKVLRDHGADIFSVLAGIGVIATGVSAYELGKARAEILDDSERSSLSKKSTIAATTTIAFGAGTIGCIYGARHYGKLKEESLLAACTVLASYSARKRGSEQTDVASGKSDNRRNSGSNGLTDIEDTGTGDVIFIEEFTGRKFKASWDCYEYAKRKLQEDFSIAQCITLNDFYALLGLSETSAGEVLGWTVDQMIMDPYYAGPDMYYEDALTQLCIEEDTDADGNVIIYYCVLPIGSLAGVGPCNY